MTYAELSEAQARRSRQFAEAQADAMSVYCDAERDLKELQAENAKLRELLVDVSEEVPWSFMDTTKYFMPLRADKLRKLLCRMRELGVEVDG